MFQTRLLLSGNFNTISSHPGGKQTHTVFRIAVENWFRFRTNLNFLFYHFSTFLSKGIKTFLRPFSIVLRPPDIRKRDTTFT